MTKDEIIIALASLPDDALDLYQSGEILHDLVMQARVLMPREPIELRHIHLDNNWPGEVAIIPLSVQGDMVKCWVGRPEQAELLTLMDLESCPTVIKTIRFFQASCYLRSNLSDIPF